MNGVESADSRLQALQGSGLCDAPDEVSAYTEAKSSAVKQLSDLVEDCLEAIASISDSSALVSENLSPFKAWDGSYDAMKLVAVARTKRRARELCGESDPMFDSRWREVEGQEFHALPKEEGLWSDEKINGQKTGKLRRYLTQADALHALELNLGEYELQALGDEMPLVGSKNMLVETNDKGVTYKVCTSIIEPDDDPRGIQVVMGLDDGLNWPCTYVRKFTIDSKYVAAAKRRRELDSPNSYSSRQKGTH